MRQAVVAVHQELDGVDAVDVGVARHDEARMLDLGVVLQILDRQDEAREVSLFGFVFVVRSSSLLGRGWSSSNGLW